MESQLIKLEMEANRAMYERAMQNRERERADMESRITEARINTFDTRLSPNNLAPAAIVAVEEPTPHEAPRPSTPADELDRYARLASELGITTIATEELLKAILADEAIHVYDLAKVSVYMYATVQKEIAKGAPPNLVWGWVPLRERDAAARPPVIRNPFRQSIELPRVYTKPVPYPVLCTVKKIVDRMGPDAVEFFVTDYGVARPDPFLAVKAKGGFSMYVIERWDEPSFR